MTELPLLPGLLARRQRRGLRSTRSRRSSVRSGSTLEEIDDWNCCGATEYMTLSPLGGYALIGRNLALAERQRNGSGHPRRPVQPVLRQPRQDRPLRPREPGPARPGEHGPRRGRPALHPGLGRRSATCSRSSSTTSASTRSPDTSSRPLHGLRVAPYLGCLVTRPDLDRRWPDGASTRSDFDRLLAALGAEVVDFPLRTACCGGHMTQISPDTGFELIRRLVDAADRLGADLLATVCPMCQMNIDAYQGEMNRHFHTNYEMPILFFTQLIGLAFGAEPADARDRVRDRLAPGTPWPASGSRCRRRGRGAGPGGRRAGAPAPKRSPQACRCRASTMRPTDERSRSSTHACPGTPDGPDGAPRLIPARDSRERIGVYVCHCGTNIAGIVDVAAVRDWAAERLGAARRRRRPRLPVHVLEPRPGAHRAGHPRARARPRGRGRVLAAHAREDLPGRLRTGRAQPVPVRAGVDPRAGLVGPHRPRRRDRQGQGDRRRRRLPRPRAGAARADPRPDQPGDARRRRRHRRHLGRPRDRRRRASRSTWSSGSPRSAATWPSSTRRSRPSTARPASSPRGWSRRAPTRTSRSTPGAR